MDWELEFVAERILRDFARHEVGGGFSTREAYVRNELVKLCIEGEVTSTEAQEIMAYLNKRHDLSEAR
jgi:hypothetical protein